MLPIGSRGIAARDADPPYSSDLPHLSDLAVLRQSRDEERSDLRHYEMVVWAEREFHQCLMGDPIALRTREYLRDRGIDEESMARFGLGFHPADREWLQTRARGKYRPEELAEVKMGQEREVRGGYDDGFVDWVLFPIRDSQCRPITFGGRNLPDAHPQQSTRYHISEEYLLFHQSQLLYGLDEAREWIAKENLALVTEGYIGCIVAHQHDLKNVVCTLGPALGESHITVLKRFARRVVLVFDGDRSGQDVTERSLSKLLAQKIDLRSLSLPWGQNPADFLNEHGPEHFRQVLREPREVWQFVYRRLVERYGIDSLNGQYRVLQGMRELLFEREKNIPGSFAEWQKSSIKLIGNVLDEVRQIPQEPGETPQMLPLPSLPDADEGLACRGSSEEGAGGVTTTVPTYPPASPLFPECQPTKSRPG